MTRKDVLYNDLRKYLQDQGVGFPADLADSLGDAFLVHLIATLFPLNNNVRKAINDKHNSLYAEYSLLMMMTLCTRS